MSVFLKPLASLATPDLAELLATGAVENIRLEFKSDVPDKDETLKKISSFANTFGGLLLVGGGANSSDGRLREILGVSPQSGYKQKIIAWCSEGCMPPVLVEVSDPIPAPSGGQVCYVIRVPESDLAPHFLNGRKGVWIRTDEFSTRFEPKLADERELRQLLDRRRIVRERRASLISRANRRFNVHSATLHADRGGNIKAQQSTLRLQVVPKFPSKTLCEQETLKSHVQKNWMPWRQVMFPDPGSQIISQHESAIVLRATKGISIFQVDVWGLHSYAAIIEKDDHSGTKGIHIFEFVGHLLLFLRHAGKSLRSLGYFGPIRILFSLAPLLQTQWLNPQQGWLAPAGISPLDDEVEFALSTTSEELAETPDDLTAQMLRQAFFAVNLPGLVDSEDDIKALIAGGIKFNFWLE